MLSWLTVSFLWLFVLVVVPYAMIGAASGYVVGIKRGRLAGAAALWGCILGPIGWILTFALTADEAREGIATAIDIAGDAISESVDALRQPGTSRSSSGDTTRAGYDDPFA